MAGRSRSATPMACPARGWSVTPSSKESGAAPNSSSARCALAAAWARPGCSRSLEEAAMTLLEQIAEKIVAIRYEDLLREAIDWAKAAILDTVGVTLAGASEDC